MKTFACQKAIAFSLLLILLFSLSIETAYSAEQEVVRVDQVYADLPEMQVYFHLLDKNGEVVTRTVSESNVLLQYPNRLQYFRGAVFEWDGAVSGLHGCVQHVKR